MTILRKCAALLTIGTALASPWWSPAKEQAVDASLLKRATNSCPATYKTSTGLDFNTYCNTNQIGWDLIDPGTETTFTTSEISMQNCMDRCASERPLCYGVAFNYQEGICWFKNSSFTYQSQSATVDNTTNLAVANPYELEPYNTSCGYKNGSIQEQNGLNFTIHCKQDIVGADYCAWNSLDCKLHATSLEDCMNQCTMSQPLCQAVAFNPDMQHGYGDCYPKTNLSQGFVATGKNIADGVVTHSAVAQIPDIPFDCTANQVIASSSGTGYTLSCNQDRPGNDITQYHSDNLTDCISTCSQWSGGNMCIAVIFDTGMVNGFRNCYLKGGVGTPVTADKSGFILALQGGTPTSSSSSSPAPSGTSSSSSGSSSSAPTGNNGSSNSNNHGSSSLSGGAIAGIVIGALAGVALVGALIFFLLRKRSDKKLQSQAEAPAAPPSGAAGTQEMQQPSSQGGYGQIDHKYTQQNGHQNAPFEAGWQPQQQTPVSATTYGSGHGGQGQYEMEEQARTELPGGYLDRAELPSGHSHVI